MLSEGIGGKSRIYYCGLYYENSQNTKVSVFFDQIHQAREKIISRFLILLSSGEHIPYQDGAG
jgi:hypothetical protein